MFYPKYLRFLCNADNIDYQTTIFLPALLLLLTCADLLAKQGCKKVSRSPAEHR